MPKIGFTTSFSREVVMTEIILFGDRIQIFVFFIQKMNFFVQKFEKILNVDFLFWDKTTPFINLNYIYKTTIPTPFIHLLQILDP